MDSKKMDSVGNDYYTILGIDKNASKEAIKKAYRKMAITYHPDKLGTDDDTKFKEISEAYNILIDDEKRQIYDQYGAEGLKQMENNPFRDAQIQLQPLIVHVECNLYELYNGTHKTVNVVRTILTGNLKNPQSLEKTQEEESFELDIEPFTTYGQKIIHKEKGHRHASEELHGDLLFVIVPVDDKKNTEKGKSTNVGEYKGYSLQDLDLHYTVKLNLSEALIGFKIKFDFLDSKPIILSTSKITKPGTVKVIPHMGFNKSIRTPMGTFNKKGNLYIHFDITFPEKLNDKQLKCIATAFGFPKIDKTIDNTEKQTKSLSFKVEEMSDPSSEETDESQEGPIFIGPNGIPISGMGMGMGMGMGEQQECCIM